MHEVDDYIASVPPPHRAEFERIREIALEIIPHDTQGLSYAMPAYFHNGWPVLSFAQTKKFLSIYPFSGKVVDKLLPMLKDFETTPGSIHFSVEHPLPDSLLKQIIAARLEEISKKKPR